MCGKRRPLSGLFLLVWLIGGLIAPTARAAADEAESDRAVGRLLQITFLGNILRALPNRVVAEDLQLSGEQCRELNRLYQLHDAVWRAAESKATYERADSEARRGLIAVLSTEQLLRTHEIFCRLHGPELLLVGVTAGELELTGPQEIAVAAVNELHGTAKWKAIEAVGFLSMNPDAMPEYRRRNLELARTTARLRQRATALMIELLVPEQRRKLERMYGRPLDIVRYYEEKERNSWDFGPDEPPDNSPSLAAPPITPRR